MNLQTVKPTARLVRDPEQRHLVFWRVAFPGYIATFDEHLPQAVRDAYEVKLALLTQAPSRSPK